MKQIYSFRNPIRIWIFLVSILLTLNANAVTTGTANGTYDFGSLGATDSGGTGFKTQGDKFKVSNAFLSGGTALYLNTGVSASVVIKAEGGSTMKQATVEDLAVGDYGTTTNDLQLTQFDITLKDYYGSTIATHSLSSSKWLTHADVLISSFSFSTAWPAGGYDNVSEIDITYTLNKSSANFEFRNIKLSNITATVAVAPTATTNAASSVTSTSATLNGSVNANNASTAVTFEYGLTDSYGSSVTAAESPVTGTSNTGVTYALSSLTPNTTYHYRVVGVNSAGTTNGSDQSFTTSAIAPTATTNAATSVTSTTVSLNGSVNANNASTAVTFEYGLTDSYGSSVTAAESPVTGTSNTGVTYALSSLAPNTTYHYRVVGVNSAGTTSGSDQSFTTSAIAPTATTNAATSVTSTTVTLNGSVNANNASTAVTFEYGLTTSYGSSVTAAESPVTGTSSTGVSYALTGLTPNTIYHYRVVGVNSAGTTNGSDESFSTPAAGSSIFTGSGNWSTPSNWTSGVPGSSTAVTIIGASTVDADITVASVSILAGNVTIAPNKTLTVSGALSNSAGLTGVVINSDATGTGMLMNNSTGVQATVKQYLVKDQWHYMGIPVTSIADANNVYHNCYLAWIDESYANDDDANGWTYMNSGEALIPLHGYAVQYNRTDSDNDTIVSFSGILNTGVIDTTFNSDNMGWNFISNPYPITLDWDASGGKTITNANDAIYVWNPNLSSGSGDYGSYGSYILGGSTNGQTRYIAPMQGFFFEVYSPGAGISFNNNAKEAQPVAFKSASAETQIRLAVTDNGINFDDMLLRVKANSTESFDRQFDASKLKAVNSKQPLVYSVLNGKEYSINSIPEITESTVISMEVLVKQAGKHTVSMTELTGFNEALPIVLFDENGKLLANLQGGDYTFDAQAGDLVKFKLAFNNTLTSTEINRNSFLTISVQDRNMEITGLGTETSEVSLYSINGQLLRSHQVQGNVFNMTNLNQGIHLLKVKDSAGLISVKKVVIN